MTLVERFQRAKHWQFFLLLFGLPLIFQFFIMGQMISGLASRNNPDPTLLFDYFKFFPILMIVILAIMFGWIWSITIGLQHKVPANVKMKTTKFKVFFFTPIVYLALILTGMSVMLSGLSGFIKSGAEPDLVFLGSLMFVIVPMHMFSIFCLFYCLYFAAKTIKTVELQRETTFSDFAGEFFMIWFYPIGIWIIQPRINRIVENERTAFNQSSVLDEGL